MYFGPGERPPPALALLMISVAPGASAKTTSEAVGSVLDMLAGLRRGHVRELNGQPEPFAGRTANQFADLAALVGYGRRLFDGAVHDPPLTESRRPDFLTYLPRQGPAFPSLPWAETDGEQQAGECDVVLQLTATSQAAVNCASVEVWKLISDLGLALRIDAQFDGFGRPDGRGWLGFHDGVSNGPSNLRLAAIESSGDPQWMRGGTYMAFLRLNIDLTMWTALPRAQQEIIVGRDKLSGAALSSVKRADDGTSTPVAREGLTADASAEDRIQWIDPPQTTDPVLEASHIHRANQNRASPDTPGGLRIFRQGYEFLDDFADGVPRTGLNFISFQRDLSVLQHLLHLPGWLGDANFGGDSHDGDDPRGRLITLAAGGLYAVPPAATPYPGAALFKT